MTLTIPLQVEADLQGFSIKAVPNHPNPECVLNEHTPTGLFDTVIKDNQDWDVTFYWRVDGATANAMGPFNWILSLHLLRLNQPGGVWSVSRSVAYAVGNPIPDDYSETITVPASKNGGVPLGLYKLHATIDIQSQSVVPVTLFGEGPIMKFYKPG